IHRAEDCFFPCRVRLRVQIEYCPALSALLALLAPLTPLAPLAPLTPLILGDAASARPRAQAVCNQACAETVRSVRLKCAWALTGSDRRLGRPAQAPSGRLAPCLRESVSQASLQRRRQPDFGEIQLAPRSCARICRGRPRRSASERFAAAAS